MSRSNHLPTTNIFTPHILNDNTPLWSTHETSYHAPQKAITNPFDKDWKPQQRIITNPFEEGWEVSQKITANPNCKPPTDTLGLFDLNHSTQILHDTPQEELNWIPVEIYSADGSNFDSCESDFSDNDISTDEDEDDNLVHLTDIVDNPCQPPKQHTINNKIPGGIIRPDFSQKSNPDIFSVIAWMQNTPSFDPNTMDMSKMSPQKRASITDSTCEYYGYRYNTTTSSFELTDKSNYYTTTNS